MKLGTASKGGGGAAEGVSNQTEVQRSCSCDVDPHDCRTMERGWGRMVPVGSVHHGDEIYLLSD